MAIDGADGGAGRGGRGATVSAWLTVDARGRSGEGQVGGSNWPGGEGEPIKYLPRPTAS